MTPAALLTELTARGVEFRIAGDKLRFRPANLLSAADVDIICKYKAEIMALIGTRRPCVEWPIIEGTEHFSLWVDDAEGSWPEFIPGYHYDIRQASRLRPVCSPAPNMAPSSSAVSNTPIKPFGRSYAPSGLLPGD